MNRRRGDTNRRALAVALVAATLVGCSASTPEPGAYGTAGTTPTSRATQQRGSRAPDDASTDQGGARATAAPGSTTQGTPEEARYLDAGSVGQMALAYIRSDPARRLTVEIDYVEGRRPSDAAMAHVEGILARDLAKPGGVSVAAGDAMPEGDGAWSFREIDSLEQRYRDAWSSGDTATMWVAFLDGQLAGERGALGVAFRASAAAVFADRVGDATTALINRTSIERSVLTHEVGHLLGLVNIGYTSAYDHEDPDNPGHSNNRRSVMYWQVEDVSIASILEGGPPDDFDEADRADLRARKD